MSFQFKQFHISHADCGMPVSTDGILLGAWARLEHAERIVDIGTGSGLLALMSAQRNPDAMISAIEIDETAYHVACQNVASSPWQNRINVIHADVREWSSTYGHVDHIICNPPYFTSGETAVKENRAIARHVDTLSHNALLQQIAALLTPNGRASLILPTYEAEQLLKQLPKMGLHCIRRCNVQTTSKKAISRLLLELALQPLDFEISSLIIQQQGKYSREFIALTWPFYLKMQKPE